MKAEINVTRTIQLDNYQYIVRVSPDFEAATEIGYRDDGDTKDRQMILIANLDDLDAIITCLTARREEIAKIQK